MKEMDLKKTYLKWFHIKYNFITIIFLRRDIKGDFNTNGGSSPKFLGEPK